MEEGSPNKAELKRLIACQVPNLAWVRFYEHPRGVPNHIPGNGSNIHNGMKCFAMDFGGLGSVDDWIYTKVDAQMILEYGYFSVLEHKFHAWRKDPTPVPIIWQPLVLHTINQEQAWSFALNFTLSLSIFTMTTLPMGCAFCQYAMPLSQLIKAGLQTTHLIAEDGAIAFQSDPATWTGARLEDLPRSVFKAPTLGDSVCSAIGELQQQERRFGGGGFWLLPSQVAAAPSFLGKCLWFGRFFYRFWIAMASVVFYIVGIFAVYFVPDDSPADANSILITVLFGLPVMVLNPVLEHVLTAKWSAIHGQSPLSTTKVLLRVLSMPFYSLMMVMVEWIILFEVAWSGSQGQVYKPRAKMANIDPTCIINKTIYDACDTDTDTDTDADSNASQSLDSDTSTDDSRLQSQDSDANTVCTSSNSLASLDDDTATDSLADLEDKDERRLPNDSMLDSIV